MFNLFKKSAKKASYDIHQVAEDCWTVHLNKEQTANLASKGLGDVRELTLTRGEDCWKAEYSYQLSSGRWVNEQTGGIAFSSDSIKSVLEQFFE